MLYAKGLRDQEAWDDFPRNVTFRVGNGYGANFGSVIIGVWQAFFGKAFSGCLRSSEEESCLYGGLCSYRVLYNLGHISKEACSGFGG